MSRIFSGLRSGDKCTGTISLFGLNSAWLRSKGMIELVGDDWIFRHATPTDEVPPDGSEIDDEDV